MEGKEIERLADQFMRSGKTIGGGDSGWIRAAFIEGYKANIETATLLAKLEKAKELIGKAKKELYDILTKSLEDAGANPREAEIIATKSDIIYELTTFLQEK